MTGKAGKVLKASLKNFMHFKDDLFNLGSATVKQKNISVDINPLITHRNKADHTTGLSL